MKVLLVNKFFYPKGGAECVFFDTASVLRDKGHKVSFFSMAHPRNLDSEYAKYFVPNVDYERVGFKDIMFSSARILYSFQARRKIGEIIAAEKPDIAHLHNIYHQISPSILHTLKKNNIPIVMTLHDYKLVCGSYLLLAAGKICEACKGGKYYCCFLKKCEKDSRLKSFLDTLEMYLHHKILHIYKLVDVFISPSKFLKLKIEEMGFRGKIIVLPNFINLNDYQPVYGYQEKSIIYVGRLSGEKGIISLARAVKGLGVKLKIIGEGYLDKILRQIVEDEKLKNVELLGYRSGEDLKEEIKKSMFLVLPSEWYENSPRVILEAFALGKPILGAKIGGVSELIKNNETGLTFESGNVKDLRLKISFLIDNPNLIIEMGRNARQLVEREFNQEIYYQKLQEAYAQLN